MVISVARAMGGNEMRCLITVAVLGVSMFAQAQEGALNLKPPKEFGQVRWFLGKFAGNETLYFGGAPQKSKGTIHNVIAIGGNWLEGKHTYATPQGTINGLHLLTYDSTAKMFKAYWFDQTTPEAMEMSGKLSGDTLTMISKPVSMGGPEKVIMRAMWKRDGARKLAFRLEMQQGPKWSPMIVGSYTRR